MLKKSESGNLRRFLLSLLVGMLLLALSGGASAAEPGNIAGTVTAEGGGPLVEVEVCARVVGGERFKCDTTRHDGTYEISNLAAGGYDVGFWSEENFITQFYSGKLTWEEAETVAVGAGATTTLPTVELEPGATISGTVTAVATGAAVPGVEACATSGVFERCAKTDAFGQYTLDGLLDRTWNVYFYAHGAPGSLLSQPYAGGPIAVGPRQAVTGVDASLTMGGQIAGTVRQASTGTPLGGVLVCATSAESSIPLACLRTPNSGAYRFTGIWASSFKIAFSAEPKELFGPEHVAEAEAMERQESLAGNGPDDYPTQWWGGQSSFAAATPIVVTPPQVVAGIDASLEAPGSPAPAPAAGTAPATTKPVLRCKRGYVKRKLRGRQRCVKRHKAKPKKTKSKHRHAPGKAKSKAR